METKLRVMIAAAVAATIVTTGLVIMKLRAQDSKDAATARHMGVDPQKYLIVTHITDDQLHNRPVTDSDWGGILSLYHDKNPFFQTEAFHLMYGMRDSPHRKDIVKLAKMECATPGAPAKATALMVLWRFGDQSWRMEAINLTTDDDAEVRKDAHFVLDKGDIQ